MDEIKRRASEETLTKTTVVAAKKPLPTAKINKFSDIQALEERIFTIALGESCQTKNWTNTRMSWRQIVDRLSQNTVTKETSSEYMAMSKEQRSKVKDVGGFFGGKLKADGRKTTENVESKSLITLDYDSGKPDILGDVERGLAGLSAYCVYSTHSHTPDKPRIRVVIPLSRDVDSTEWEAISRRVAEGIDIDQIDERSFTLAQFMYWPSSPKDITPVFRSVEGKALDVEMILNSYSDFKDQSEWPRTRKEKDRAKRQSTMDKGATAAKKVEDPTKKTGIVGAFCRAYSISKAIATFLGDVYEPSDRMNHYTFMAGSSAGGLAVYDDKLAYSHHGTDPASGKELNSYDLVRIHKFGHLDKDSDTDRASQTAMRDFALNDPDVMNELGDGISIREDFALDSADQWKQQLTFNKNGGLEPRMNNYTLVLLNHPNYRGKIYFDPFNQKVCKKEDIPLHPSGKSEWTYDGDTMAVLLFFSRLYHVENQKGIENGLTYALNFVPQVHPVKDYLESLPEWDGKPRLDTLVIDYLGGEDDPIGLTRAVTRKHFVAAVKRIYEPGCKYDQILTFGGPQGIGKSMLIRKMFDVRPGWVQDKGLVVGKQNEAGMYLAGVWAYEFGELTDYKKSTSEAYKNFMSSQSDRVRVPYARDYVDRPRVTVFFATTNENHFLKGESGNRRWWVISCSGVCQKKPWSELPDERNQIWAEAMYRYRAGEDVTLSGDLTDLMDQRQERCNEINSDLRIDKVRAYMKAEVPDSWRTMSKAERRQWLYYQTVNGFAPGESQMIPHPPVCYLEIAEECLGLQNDRYAKQTIKDILTKVGVRRSVPEIISDKAYGKQRRWELVPEIY